MKRFIGSWILLLVASIVMMPHAMFSQSLSAGLGATKPEFVFGLAPRVTAQNADVVGTWEVTTHSPEGDRTNTMVVTKDGAAFKAVAKSERGELPYDSVAVEGSKVTIVLTISYQGAPMVITYTGRIDKTAMNGEADFGGLAQGTWSATRQ